MRSLELVTEECKRDASFFFFSACKLSFCSASAMAGREPWGADDCPSSLDSRDRRKQRFFFENILKKLIKYYSVANYLKREI